MTFCHPVWIRFHGVDRGPIRQTDDGTHTSCEDTDTVLIPDRRLVTGRTAEALAGSAARHGLDLKETQRRYDKLFYGHNLSSITPAGEYCRPSVTEGEPLRSLLRKAEDPSAWPWDAGRT